MANVRKRISELTALTSASLDTTLVGVDGGTTYKIELDTLADAVTSRVNILDRSRLSALESVTSSFETNGRSVISSSAQITSYGFISQSVDITSLNSFTSSQLSYNTAFTNGISSRLTTSSFDTFSQSVDSRIIAATNEQSFNGLISGSSQFTSSYDERYVLSGSITQTTWDNISGKPNGLVSQSTDLSSLNTFTQSVDNRVDSLESWSSSLTDTFATDLEVSIVSSSVAATIGIISQNTGLVSTSSFNQYTSSISTASLVDRLNAIENVSGSWITENETGSFLTSLNGAISSSEQVLGGSGVYSSSAQINGNIYSAGSSFTFQDLLIGAGTTFGKITTDGSKYISIMPTYNTESARFWSNGNVTIQDAGDYVDNGFKLEVSGSTRIVGSFVATDGITGSTNFDTIVNKPTLISGSSQLTSSYDTRYVISGSVGATPLGTISGSAQISEFGFISSSQTINTASLATTGSNTFIGTETISGSLLLSGSFSYNGTPLQNGFAFAQPILTKILDNVSYTSGTAWRASYTSNGGAIIVTANMSGFRSSIGSGTAQLLRDGVAVASHTFYFNIANYHTPITPLVYVSNSETGSHTYEVFYSNILADTQDYATINVLEYGNSAMFPITIISGSSQLTSSFDTRYLNTGGDGVISGSSQLTSSYDTRYAPSASYLTSLNGTISGSSQLTSSFDSRYTLSGSSVTINTGSLATTGSNSFNGNQTITGSLIVSAVAVVNGGVTIPTGSTITLTSGSSISVDSTGAITGSLTGSVYGIGDVVAFSASVNSRLNSVGGVAGTVSSSAQITAFGFVSGSYETTGRSIVSGSSQIVSLLPTGVISGSSQLTSSYDTRYTLSGSVSAVPSGTISGSAQITAFGFISSSSAPAGTISGSSQITGIVNLTNLSATSQISASVFVGGFGVAEAKYTVISAKPMTFYPNPSIESVRFTTAGAVLIGGNHSENGFKLSVTGSARIIGTTVVTGSLVVSDSITGTILATNGVISGSSQLTSSYDTRYALSGSGGTIPGGTISGSTQITTLGFATTSSLNTLTASFNSFTASAQSVTTGSNSFNGTQTITGSLIITTGSFVASQILANTASLYLTSGSNLYVQNNGVVEITGSLIVSGSTTLKVPVLYVGTGSGVEGGEIDLAYAQSGNTTLTGSAIVFDIWQDRVRIFENGGTNRGGYFDISTLGAGVGTDLSNLTYFIEAYANVSYTLPGSYTDDVCRYSVVSTNVNVPTSWFNTSSYTFTPLKAGYWEIIASYDVYRNGEASLLIKKNGTTVASAGAISSVAQQITKIIYLNGSTDYINVYNAGVSANARTQTSSNAFFQARFVGA